MFSSFRKLRGLKLERMEDGKLVPLHAYEVSSLANLVKDVSLPLPFLTSLFDLGCMLLGGHQR